MKLIHIIAGFLALSSGFIALYALKGGKLHRQSGTLFAYAMLVMAGLGAIMAARLPERLSSLVGVLTCYLVTTSLLAVKRRPGEPFLAIDFGAMLVALGVAATSIGFAAYALRSGSGRMDGYPATGYFIVAGVALLAAALDIRMLIAGDLRGAHRIARHLWRMGLALWIATGSFFLGQAKLFPEPVRKFSLLAIPVLLVLVTTVYWLVRTLRRSRPARTLVPASSFSR